MTQTLKLYPRMKDSGVEWLGEIPEHWEVRKLRSILRGITERNRSDLPLLSVVRSKGVIIRNVADHSENHNFIPDDLSNYKVVRKGQFAMNKMKAWQGSYGVSKYNGIVSPAYYVFDTTDVYGDFFHMAVRSKSYVPFFVQSSDGVRIGQWDLSQSRMREIRFLLPPLSEQTAIVKYLNHVDRKVKRFIRAKRKLIGLLEEQKQAIIHNAVTRGLDPNVPMKDSGVQWLGEVPEHWEVVPLRYLATKFGSGVTPRGGASVYTKEGIPFLRSQNIHFSGLHLDYVARIPPALHQSLSNTHIRSGDVLLNITGASIGRVCFVPECFKEGNVNQHVCIIRVRQQVLLPQYLSLFLSTPGMQREIRFEQNGASREGLTLDAIRNFKIALPSITEQIDIVDHILGSTYHIDSIITRAQREIALLNEYHTRLISDVVTGKLDVREAAVALPEEMEKLLSADEDWSDDGEDETEELDTVPEEFEAE